ncbi:anti-sigma factor [Catenovulum sediminis]|uniref:Anti-sigma factor n=1 Tax=Catenovulum sediminis TaxID=1740262 RepID=A0ABV1RGB0_9ALTE|nr:anti-sigma factor [Catenovulum sediminis]
MNYLLEARRNALAAEYVLGTLQGGARRRYQQLMMQYSLIRETTWMWEQQINDLSRQLDPVTPEEVVWQKISQRLGFVDVPAGNIVPLVQKKKSAVWQWATGLATAAALILAVVLIRVQTVEVTPPQVAVVQGEKAQALWLIEIDDEIIRVKASDNLQPQLNNDYELWMVAKDGRAPVSLGLLPKSGQLELAKHALFEQVEIVALAVSLEPLGGSPNGLPTTVLYTTELMTL